MNDLLYLHGLAGGGSSVTYMRPADWPTLPTVLESDQKFVGIHAVHNTEGNFCALSASGAYTVNWGDGVTESFSAGVTSYHVYAFADTDLPAVTSRGYKCAVVTVTPQAGQNLTALNLHLRHNQAGVNTYTSGFLDIALAGQYLTDLRVGAERPGVTSLYVRFSMLERVNLVRSDLRQCDRLFTFCSSLWSAKLSTSSKVAVTGACTFQDTGDTVTMAGHGGRVGDCVRFNSIVTTTGLAVKTLYYIVNAATDTFQVSGSYGGSALALTSNGSGNVSIGTGMSNTFSSCAALRSVTLSNTSGYVYANSMFYGCAALPKIPLFDTSACRDMSSMFSGCAALQEVPLFDTSTCDNLGNAFSRCASLRSVPLLDTSACTSMVGIFSYCYSLAEVPMLDTSACVFLSSMFSSCTSLRAVPALNTGACTSFASMLSTAGSLSKIDAYGMRVAFSVASCNLSSTELLKVIDNLGSTASAQAFTISSNWGLDVPVSLSGTVSVGSATVTMANTTGVAVGMQVTGSGMPNTTALACTFQDTGDTVTATAHGLVNDAEVSLATVVTTTGIVINTIYFVVNTAANTFQVASTPGGAPLALTGNGTGTLRYRVTVTAIDPNVSVTLSGKATASAAPTLAFRTLRTDKALLKGWTVTG